MELFGKSFKSLWESEGKDKKSVPEVVERNVEFLCAKDLDYLISLSEKPLNDACYHALIECLIVVGKNCSSHEKKVRGALEKLSDHESEEVASEALDAIETLSRPSIAPVIARFGGHDKDE